MTGHHGDIMISIIHAALLKSSDSFNPDFEVFKRDIGGLFASIVKNRLKRLSEADECDNEYPIKQMTEILSECTWEFERKIDNIVYKALDAANKSFCDDMTALFEAMSDLIADEVRASA